MNVSPDTEEASPVGLVRMRALMESPGSLGPNLRAYNPPGAAGEWGGSCCARRSCRAFVADSH